MRTIIGLFDNAADSRAAVEELKKLNTLNISYATNKNDWFDRNVEIVSESPDPVSSTATGASVGILAGLVITALAIPGFGPLFAAGPILGLLGSGAVTGGVVGALAGWGVGEGEAKIYADKIKAGSAMVTAEVTDADQQSAQDILKTHHASEIRVYESITS